MQGIFNVPDILVQWKKIKSREKVLTYGCCNENDKGTLNVSTMNKSRERWLYSRSHERRVRGYGRHIIHRPFTSNAYPLHTATIAHIKLPYKLPYKIHFYLKVWV